VKPHRGVLILVLGIIGLVACQILGPVAWILGNADMKEIKAGRMDPEGESMTNIGRILGIVATVLLVVSFCVGIAWFFILAGIVAGGAAAQ
jgi:hypothetical protein